MIAIERGLALTRERRSGRRDLSSARALKRQLERERSKIFTKDLIKK
jgi:hypothetical protein